MMVLNLGFPISNILIKDYGSFEIEILDSIPPLSDPLRGGPFDFWGGYAFFLATNNFFDKISETNYLFCYF
jgi:hypothetical protein